MSKIIAKGDTVKIVSRASVTYPTRTRGPMYLPPLEFISSVRDKFITNIFLTDWIIGYTTNSQEFPFYLYEISKIQ
jgi:hypothetical protein